MDLDLQIRDERGRVDHAETPDDLATNEFLKEFISATGRSWVDEQGDVIAWVLVDVRTGQALEATKTLWENGIRSDRELHLRVNTKPAIPVLGWQCPKCRFENPKTSAFCAKCGARKGGKNIQLVVQDPKGRLLTKQVSPELQVKRFLHDVLTELGLETKVKWNLDDKDIPKVLTLDETFEQNGVLDGHHLFLRPMEEQGGLSFFEKFLEAVPWKAIGIGILVVVAAALCGYGGFKLIKKAITPSVAVSISPSGNFTLHETESKQFTASVSGTTDHSVTWSIASGGVGTIAQNGKYLAPATISQAQQVDIVATSVADKSKSARASVHLATTVPPRHDGGNISVHITPPAKLQLAAGEKEQFSVAGGDSAQVVWSIDPPGVGAIAPDGTYTAPASVLHTQTVTVIATSAADPARRSPVEITLMPSRGPHLSIVPSSPTLEPNGTQQFTVVADPHGSHPPVRWSVSPKVGSISQSGLYTAPGSVSQQQTIRIRAVLVGDATHGASATVTLHRSPPPVPPFCGQIQWVGFETITLGPSQTHEFQITGADPAAVHWAVLGPGVIDHGSYTAPSTVASTGEKAYVKARCQGSQEILRVVNLVP